MPVNFYATPCNNSINHCTTFSLSCLTIIPNPQFGITDDDGADSSPARVDFSNSAIWDLTVLNKSGVDVMFKAIDWCVLIFRTGTYDLENENRTAVQFSSDNVGQE
jgi:hypothetical protein